MKINNKKKCLYCNQQIQGEPFNHKVGYFCSEEHFDAYCETLSKEELALLMHSICPCSDEG
ncbi:hypothetical protein PBV87_04790 [Niameybacter massiliensis]|uniref:Uncharacterized protein n=1 Tax=Holtiella tumoricola TaxID=3018743 RepID=A0AA42DKU9_9FIRM|nr:hypothetical protein [Holtiella tumoricola]MDA3730814.1 hypothetical protein [Holtiella tumoricola]